MSYSTDKHPDAIFTSLCSPYYYEQDLTKQTISCSSDSCALPLSSVQLGFFTFSFPTHDHFCISGTCPNSDFHIFSFLILNREFTLLLDTIIDHFSDNKMSCDPIPEFSSPHELVLRFNTLLAFLKAPNMSALTSKSTIHTSTTCHTNSINNSVATAPLFDSTVIASTLFNHWNLHFLELHSMAFKSNSLTCHDTTITPLLSTPLYDIFHLRSLYTQAMFDNTMKHTPSSTHLNELIELMHTKLPIELIQQIRYEHFPPAFTCQCQQFTNFGTASNPQHATLFPFSGKFCNDSPSIPIYEQQFVLHLPNHSALSTSISSPPFANPLMKFSIFLSCSHHFGPKLPPSAPREVGSTRRALFTKCKNALTSDQTSKNLHCTFRDFIPTYKDDPPMTIRTC